MTARPYAVRPARRVTLEAGPWRGVRDDLSPNAASPEWLQALTNGYLDNLATGPTIVGRPGFSQLGAQLASGGTRTVQRCYQFTKLAGTQYTVAIVNGEIYTYDWATDTTTKVVTTANLTTASVTLSSTAKVYAVTFADDMVISDGVNAPFTWDGTSGAGGLTALTNCPVLYGQPVVYYAKLFGIKNTERSTIVWSEEADANVGYEALIGGRQYNNAWTIGQTDQRPLYALAATNRALYLFRARSITEVLGAVADDFQTTGTREAVSSVIGCQSPDGVTVVNEDVWFWSADHAPYVIRAGGGLQEVAEGLVRATSGSPKTVAALAAVVSVYVDFARAVAFGLPAFGGSVPSLYVLVSVETGTCIGIWQGWTCATLDVVTDDNGRDRLVHGGGSSATTSAAGYLYAFGRPGLTIWTDEFAAADAPIAHSLTTGYLLWDAALQHRLDRVTVSHTTASGLTGCSLDVVTPDGVGTVQSFAVSGAGGMVWNQDDWDEEDWAGTAVEAPADLGRAEEGRWFQVRVAHATAAEEWGVNRIRLEAFVRDARTGVN